MATNPEYIARQMHVLWVVHVDEGSWNCERFRESEHFLFRQNVLQSSLGDARLADRNGTRERPLGMVVKELLSEL